MTPDNLKFVLVALGVIGIIGAVAWLHKKDEEAREYDNPDKW